MTDRCGKWMPRAQAECVFCAGHAGHCRAIDPALWREANREQIRVQQQAHRESHRDEKRAYDEAYRESNRERLRQNKRTYYKANPHIYEERVQSGRLAGSSARYRRRKADERCGNIDPRLETLLGGLIGPSTT